MKKNGVESVEVMNDFDFVLDVVEVYVIEKKMKGMEMVKLFVLFNDVIKIKFVSDFYYVMFYIVKSIDN